jgi:hypothetical protein
MEKLRTKDKIALVIAVLTAIAAAQDGAAIDVLIAVGINVAIVYGVAAIVENFKKRS